LDNFAKNAKKRIQEVIDEVAKNQSQKDSQILKNENNLVSLIKKFLLTSGDYSNSDPYIFKVNNIEDANRISKTINEYCIPIIHNFWLDTQDRLIREGKNIRQDLVKKIKEEIQAISDEISEYLGKTLDIKINTNVIQFPDFEFLGLDTEIQNQQKVFIKNSKEERINSRCCDSNEIYYVNIQEIDLKRFCQAFNEKIDEQIVRNKQLLQRVIQKQVSKDFKKAENQINDYINRFQFEFDNLLKERAEQELKADEIMTNLTSQRMEVNQYLNELMAIRELLNS
ncbi:MAG: dynamin family protein, partial [Cyanobacteria bacterium J06635_10]